MIPRRSLLKALACGLLVPSTRADDIRPGRLLLSTFRAEVTPPIGHPCMGGGIEPVKEITDALEALGVVLLGAGRPIVIAAIDWCEIRNDAYDRWRDALAEAAGTDRARVLLASVHQHDAPIADLRAEHLLRQAGAAGSICDPDFHEQAVRRVADALKESLPGARPITHLGTGEALVEGVASNRRTLDADGRPRFDRTSATRDPELRARPEGTIDPKLRSLTFWEGDRPRAALHFYATHPMSHYGRGSVSADFVGLARRRLQASDPGCQHIYFSGCSGNVTAGKFNDGDPANRAVLAGRIERAMREALESTRRSPLETPQVRIAELRLEPRGGPGFTEDDLTKRIRSDPKPFGQCLAALGLSWRARCVEGRLIDLPVIDFGPGLLALLPAEAYVEYQLLAQRLRPDAFVTVAGYGECGPGYIPIDRAWDEHDTNLTDWCWVAPGAEARMEQALRQAMEGRDGR